MELTLIENEDFALQLQDQRGEYESMLTLLNDEADQARAEAEQDPHPHAGDPSWREPAAASLVVGRGGLE